MANTARSIRGLPGNYFLSPLGTKLLVGVTVERGAAKGSTRRQQLTVFLKRSNIRVILAAGLATTCTIILFYTI